MFLLGTGRPLFLYLDRTVFFSPLSLCRVQEYPLSLVRLGVIPLSGLGSLFFLSR